MRRHDLFEIEDQPWCPRAVRGEARPVDAAHVGGDARGVRTIFSAP
jgi:hypothetical protein